MISKIKTIFKFAILFFTFVVMGVNKSFAQSEEQTPQISEVRVSATPEKGLVSNHVYEGVQVAFEAVSQGAGQWEFEWTENETIVPAQKQSKYTQIIQEVGATAYPVEREYKVSARCIIDKTVETERLDTIVKDSIIKDSIIVEKDSVIKDSVIVVKDSVVKDSVITETDTIIKDSLVTISDIIVNDSIVKDTIINTIIITTVVKDTIDNIIGPSVTLSIWPKPDYGEDKILENQIVKSSCRVRL